LGESPVTLRPYQSDLYVRVREAFRTHRRVLACAPTGSGKTRLFAEMTRASSSRGWNVWIVVPRNELLEQASDELARLGVRHGRIAASGGSVEGRESAAYDVHVVSKDTLIRRFDKIKRPPQFLIVDEAHLALDRYIEIAERYPEAKLLGVTATPERLDGRGLSELYEVLVLGPTPAELVEQGHLSGVRYYCPPISLKGVHRRGTEYDEEELAALLEKRQIYGKAIEHYTRHAREKPALVYCRSVKAAEETAHRFSAAGYRFENIDGRMSYKRRRALIDGLRDGALDGLTSCDLITYGLDVPRVECVIMLRPTLSRTLFSQMCGRGLRVWPGKTYLVVLDHVGNLQEHGHPLAPYQWNFDGRERRARNVDPAVRARLCPEIDFLYCDRPSCTGCPHAPADGKDPRRALEEVDGELVEVLAPIRMADRPPDDRREIERAIERAVAEYQQEVRLPPPTTGGVTHVHLTPTAAGAIGRLLEIAKITGRDPMWVYWELSRDRVSVNVTLLHEIARQRGYKPGWVWIRQKEIAERVRRRAG
jgi:DNA repair protein RadD